MRRLATSQICCKSASRLLGSARGRTSSAPSFHAQTVLTHSFDCKRVTRAMTRWSVLLKRYKMRKTFDLGTFLLQLLYRNYHSNFHINFNFGDTSFDEVIRERDSVMKISWTKRDTTTHSCIHEELLCVRSEKGRKIVLILSRFSDMWEGSWMR